MLFTHRLNNRQARDEGSALAAVIGVMAVGLLLSALIMTSVVGGMGYTSATKAGVQSQASADAGLAVAKASLLKGTCSTTGGIYVSAPGVTPSYSASIWRQSGSGWVQGCPLSSVGSVRVLSSGVAQASAVAGQTGNNSSAVEAVFSTPAVPVTITPTGPALYSYSSNGFGGAGRLVAGDATSPNVFVKTGNVNCNGAAGMDGDLVVAGGNLTLDGSCNVSGNVWASGTVTITGGVTVSGNVTAAAVTISNGTVRGNVWSPGTTTIGSATITGSVISGPITLSSSTVSGSVWSTGSVSSSASIGGNITSNGTLTISGGSVSGSVWSTGDTSIAATMPRNVISGGSISFSGSGKIQGSAWATGNVVASSGQDITGNVTATNITTTGANIGGVAWATNVFSIIDWLTIDGSVTAKSKSGTGGARGGFTIKPGGTGPGPAAPARPAAGPAAIAAPFVPDWVDFDYVAADWDGFAVVTMTGTCDWSALQVAKISLAGSKGIINAMNCTDGITIGGSDQLDLGNDLVIVAKKFTLTGGGGFTSSAARKLWLITPDAVKDHVPAACPAGWGFTVDGGFTFSPLANISTMIYTPCRVTVASGIQLRGQIFAGSASVDGGATMTYVGVGLPGVNLTTGTNAPPAGTPPVYKLEYTRNAAAIG
jgi:cytoskeletal protein CcmA (bactofilin family)